MVYCGRKLINKALIVTLVFTLMACGESAPARAELAEQETPQAEAASPEPGILD